MSGIRREHGGNPPAAQGRAVRTRPPVERAARADRHLDAPLAAATGAAAARVRRRAAAPSSSALDVEDLQFDAARGAQDEPIGSSKSDQARGRGANRRAVRARGKQMRRATRLTGARLSDQSVALIVKRRAQARGPPDPPGPAGGGFLACVLMRAGGPRATCDPPYVDALKRSDRPVSSPCCDGSSARSATSSTTPRNSAVAGPRRTRSRTCRIRRS